MKLYEKKAKLFKKHVHFSGICCTTTRPVPHLLGNMSTKFQGLKCFKMTIVTLLQSNWILPTFTIQLCKVYNNLPTTTLCTRDRRRKEGVSFLKKMWLQLLEERIRIAHEKTKQNKKWLLHIYKNAIAISFQLFFCIYVCSYFTMACMVVTWKREKKMFFRS